MQRISSSLRSSKAPARHLDLLLLVSVAGLCSLGAIAIYSATRVSLQERGLDAELYMSRQLIFLVLGLAVLLITATIDYHHYKIWAPIFYGVAVILLLAVLTPLGHSSQGAQRWIGFGPFQLQPSEVAKISLLIVLCALLSESKGNPGTRDVSVGFIAMILPAGLVYLQPDLGTMLVISAIFFFLMLAAGVRLRWLAAIAGLGVVAMLLVVQMGLLKDYQKARLTAFLNPSADTRSAGYNLVQSKIAIGSGGLSGRGLFRGTQTNLDYVPEQHTDFIFTAIGEELGFAGSMTLLACFSLLLWRALRISVLAKDQFGSLLAAGIAGVIAFQVFVNMGMTMGIMPITGIPLPFVSYGGSSLLTSMIAVGLLQNVHMRRFR